MSREDKAPAYRRGQLSRFGGDVKVQILLVIVLFALVFGASGVIAKTDLGWEPRWSAVPHGDTGSISILLDDPLPLRSIEVWIEYDTSLISDLVGDPGAVFDGVPCFLFEDFGETEPGVWHGFIAIIGGECQTVGPGILLDLSFTAGVNPGICHFTTVDVKLFKPDANLYPDVSLNSAYVIIGPEATDVPHAPAVGFSLSPNPFNPAVNLEVELTQAMPAIMSVFDQRGQRVARPWSGTLPSGTSSVTWRGTSDNGAHLPSGSYIFVLEIPGRAPLAINGTLIR